MSWSIQKVARASGVTARTLRYYDEIGLLAPARIGSNGHRIYEQTQLLRLQQILLLRELDVDLATIREVVDVNTDPTEALGRHHRDLLAQRERLDRITATVTATLQKLEAGREMTAENLFEGMSPERANYLAGLPKKRVAAGALFADGEGRTLLVAPTYKPYWQLPGGVADADESPLAAATRAVRRELGLDVELGRLLVVDWVEPSANKIEGLLFVFDGGTLSPEQSDTVVLPPAELGEWAWCGTEQLPQRLPDFMLLRIQTAIRARASKTTTYLENGAPAA
ncbi:MerR family transcriptional regulator [Mycolicibacterium iranicum]|uniref:MerR family transcriptional regulator n=1 Tax=Mycolicibacterium iranicum TaxID=912594 RepID=A0ABT4HL22_MYCIR|nr:MerR family transcriptional regulator [Mycolicibacterium iranicum]MCZ0730918.1 MerR family transcriptional regulator [Mycolicibacterium iranicum]